MKKGLLFLFPILLIGCPRQEEPETPRPVPFADDDPAWCDEGCQALRKLPGQDNFPGCLEARPLVHPELCQLDVECKDVGGTCVNNHCTETCEQFCVATIEAGRFLGPKCWTTVSTCAEIETVCRR
jgi:hypothetical protein